MDGRGRYFVGFVVADVQQLQQFDQVRRSGAQETQDSEKAKGTRRLSDELVKSEARKLAYLGEIDDGFRGDGPQCLCRHALEFLQRPQRDIRSLEHAQTVGMSVRPNSLLEVQAGDVDCLTPQVFDRTQRVVGQQTTDLWPVCQHRHLGCHPGDVCRNRRPGDTGSDRMQKVDPPLVPQLGQGMAVVEDSAVSEDVHAFADGAVVRLGHRRLELLRLLDAEVFGDADLAHATFLTATLATPASWRAAITE
ncbi:hypothetical protein CWE27_05960 [Streptomyces sp. EAG2]|nr:hypothetical protein CWE27_05960 [Streptomyces sp. EAG2]